MGEPSVVVELERDAASIAEGAVPLDRLQIQRLRLVVPVLPAERLRLVMERRRIPPFIARPLGCARAFQRTLFHRNMLTLKHRNPREANECVSLDPTIADVASQEKAPAQTNLGDLDLA
jgi:hypothetical protein